MMKNQIRTVPCSIVRGGTSKAVYLEEKNLPAPGAERDKLVLAVFGSPSLRQLDGLGGADITTSKVAIIGPATRPDADVDYTFGQVSMEASFVDWSGNCGNISSGVGPFAIHAGYVQPVEPMTTVRIHMTNSNQILIAKVLVQDGQPCVDGECVIGGVPGTGSPIEMDWKGCAGSTTGKLLPTGHAVDEIEMDGKRYPVSIVDEGNTVVYVRAEDLGVSGTESPMQLNQPEMLRRMEKLRGLACEKIGLVDSWEEAIERIPYQPFLSILSAPQSYNTYTGERVAAEDTDIVARMYLMRAVVKAYPGTGTANLGCAARVPGSLVEQTVRASALDDGVVRIGHPTGTITVYTEAETRDNGLEPVMTRLSFIRTARVLLDGTCYVRESVL